MEKQRYKAIWQAEAQKDVEKNKNKNKKIKRLQGYN